MRAHRKRICPESVCTRAFLDRFGADFASPLRSQTIAHTDSFQFSCAFKSPCFLKDQQTKGAIAFSDFFSSRRDQLAFFDNFEV